MCRARRIALASHDDATEAHVAESHQLGERDRRFPTTLAAAQASRQHGMHVLMGRRISCAAVPTPATSPPTSWRATVCWTSSHLTIAPPACWMPLSVSPTPRGQCLHPATQAIRLVSQHPAQALGLDDRGVIAEGNAPTWCWRTVAANISKSTMSWRQERGSLMPGN